MKLKKGMSNMRYFMIFIKLFITILIATFFVVPIGRIVQDSIVRSVIMALTITIIDYILKKSGVEDEK